MTLPTNQEKVLESFSIFSDSVLFEFLQPSPSLHATVLMRATYRTSHPYNKLGKSHPQAPPFHLHFSQSESFVILSGRIATTIGYDCTDTIWTAANTWNQGHAHLIKPWTPHRFWPVPSDYDDPSSSATTTIAEQQEEEKVKNEDAILLAWAHPQVSGDLADGGMDMDYLFFRNVVLLTSDMHEGKLKEKSGLSGLAALGAVFAMQDATDGALVWGPKVWVLGGLRWWVPLKIQGLIAWIWWWTGGGGNGNGRKRRDGLIEAYTPKKEWERLEERKGR